MEINLANLKLSKPSLQPSAIENPYIKKLNQLQEIMKYLHQEKVTAFLGEDTEEELVAIFAALLLDTSGAVKEYDEDSLIEAFKIIKHTLSSDDRPSINLLKQIYNILNGAYIEDEQEFSNIGIVNDLIDKGGFASKKEKLCQIFCKRIIQQQEITPEAIADMAFSLFEIEDIESQAKILVKLKSSSKLISSLGKSEIIETPPVILEKPINILERAQQPVERFLSKANALSLNNNSKIQEARKMLLDPMVAILLETKDVTMMANYFTILTQMIQSNLPNSADKIYASVLAIAESVCHISNFDGAELFKILPNIIDKRLLKIAEMYSKEERQAMLQQLNNTFNAESSRKSKIMFQPESEIKSAAKIQISVSESNYHETEKMLVEKERMLIEKEKKIYAREARAKEIEAQFEALQATNRFLSQNQSQLQQSSNIAPTTAISAQSPSIKLPPPPALEIILGKPESVNASKLPPPPPLPVFNNLGLSSTSTLNIPPPPPFLLLGSIPSSFSPIVNTSSVPAQLSIEEQIAKAREAMSKKSAQKPLAVEYSKEQQQAIKSAEELIKSPLNMELWKTLNVQDESSFHNFFATNLKIGSPQAREINIIGFVKQLKTAGLNLEKFKLLYQLNSYEQIGKDLPPKQEQEESHIASLREQLAERSELLKTVITKFELDQKKTVILPEFNLLPEKEIDNIISEFLESKGIIGVKLITAKTELKSAVNSLPSQAKTAENVKKLIMEKATEIKF